MNQLSRRDLSQGAVFMVATLGYDEHERTALRDLLRTSEYRTPTFRALVKDAGIPPHIVIVNSDRPDAVAKWEALRRGSEGKARLTGILWGAQKPGQPCKYTLPRPALATDLIELLDRIVQEEHGYRETTGAAVRTQTLFALCPGELKPVVTPPAAAAEPPAPPAVPPVAAPSTAGPAAAPDYISTVIIEPPRNDAGEFAVVFESTAAAAAPTPPPTLNKPAPESPAVARISGDTPRSGPAFPAQARFLVVDDSLPVRIQMREALQRFARTIDFAHDGEQALILIDNCKYDVIFLDVILPGKDGYDVCRYIRNHPLQRQTPVIMLTGNSAPADRVKGKLAGCDTYLIKPVRQSVLAEVIGEFVKAPEVA